jgi:hypothetical protein
MEYFLAIYLNGQQEPLYPVREPFATARACAAAEVQARADPRGQGYVVAVRCEPHRRSEHFVGRGL